MKNERGILQTKNENIDTGTQELFCIDMLMYSLLILLVAMPLPHSPSLPQTLLAFLIPLAHFLPVDWGPQVGERGVQRRDGLLFPHNNKGIHGHPAPHQSTERGKGLD